jgi:CheY-like chemotaxis protein
MKKILVVDDNQLVATLLMEALSAAGYEVSLAHDANDGYSAALEFRPDLILCDVQLPDVVGFDLVRVIKNRAELRDVPIIMITGTAHSTAEKVRGFQLGADDYILKPFEMPELLERVSAVLRRGSRGSAAPAVATPPFQVPVHTVSSPAAAAAKDFVPVVPDFITRRDLPSQAPAQPVPHPAAVKAEAIQTSSAFQVVFKALTDPTHLSMEELPPALSRAFLTAATVFVAAGLLIAEGSHASPILSALAVPLVWGLLLTVVVMASSLAGVQLSWRDGSRLFSLSAVPWLLKISGGFIFTVITTLSPFEFSAGPSLLTGSHGALVLRLDAFELWSVWLLSVLLAKRPGGDKKKGRAIAALVWICAFGLAVLFARAGSGS